MSVSRQVCCSIGLWLLRRQANLGNSVPLLATSSPVPSDVALCEFSVKKPSSQDVSNSAFRSELPVFPSSWKTIRSFTGPLTPSGRILLSNVAPAIPVVL